MGEPRSPRGLIAYKPPLSQPGRAAQKRTSSGKDAIYSSAPISPKTFRKVGGIFRASGVDGELLDSRRMEATESELERCACVRRARSRMSRAVR